MKFLLATIFVTCVLASAYAAMPKDVATITKDGKVGRCTATKNGDKVQLSCRTWNGVDPNDTELVRRLLDGETPISWNEFMMRVMLGDDGPNGSQGPKNNGGNSNAASSEGGMPQDVLTFTKEGKVARCTATKTGEGLSTSCQVYGMDPNDKALLEAMFPGETPISYEDFQARAHNPKGWTADTAESPEPMSDASRGFVKQQVQTRKGPVPVLTLVA